MEKLPGKFIKISQVAPGLYLVLDASTLQAARPYEMEDTDKEKCYAIELTLLEKSEMTERSIAFDSKENRDGALLALLEYTRKGSSLDN